MQSDAESTALGTVTYFEATDGVEALKLISANPAGFGLMMVDWNMPSMNGLELIGRIRKTDQRTPIVMVTTEGEKGHVLDAIKAGASSYIVKPFTALAILEKVQ